MNIRTAITENSVWKFDLDLNRYIRFPKGEDLHAMTIIPYTGEWDEFVKLERWNDRIIVHRPVPYGEGALRMTGPIEWDDIDLPSGSQEDERIVDREAR